MDAPITIKYTMERNSIIAASFTEPIWIGLEAFGAIVATDPDDGYIPEIQIGYEPYVHPAYADVPLGMVAVECYPMLPTLTSPIDLFTADDWLRPPPDGVDPSCFEGGTSDTLLRAKHIGVCRVHTMSSRFDASQIRKNYRPRIEAEHIDSLEITDMREGVVWSGALEFTNGVLANDPGSDYSRVDVLTIGTVGPWSDVWFMQCPRARFTEDVLGELHLPRTEPDEVLAIDDGLLNYDTLCGCEDYHPDTCPYPVLLGVVHEASPRWSDCAAEGAVRIADSDGLHGQVIINAALGGGTWDGLVAVGTTELRPGAAQPYQAPFYDHVSADLGGGSVGLAPYSLHGEDCHPPHNHLGRADGVSQRDFEDPDNIAVWAQSYGPMAIPEGGSLTDYVYILVQDPADPCGWLDMTGMFTLVLHPDLNQNNQTDPDELRYIGLKKNGHIPLPGIYRLVNWLARDGLDLPYDVMLDWPVWTPPPGTCTPYALEPSYVFRIWPDCDDDGLNDLVEIDNTPSLDTDGDDVLDSCESSCHLCDVNQSGAVTVQDIFDFLFAYFQGSACIGPVPNTSCANASPASSCEVSSGGSTVAVDADVNDSCSVTVQDIFDFLACYFASTGDCP